MKHKRARFTLCIDETLLNKIRHIAKVHGTTVSHQIAMYLEIHTAYFEKRRGKIVFDEAK